MNASNKNNHHLDLQLQEMSHAEMGSLPSAVELELAMTNSAFGFEYAATALRNSGDTVGSDVFHLQLQIDQHKDDYFNARKKLEKIDRERLQRFEKDLAIQKLVVFTSSPAYVH